MSFLSRLHTDLRRTRLTRRGATKRPEDVPCYTHKEYPRMMQLLLPEPAPLNMTLTNALYRRHSAHSGDPSGALALKEVGDLLGNALRVRRGKRRPYPSGGALYPIETYLISLALEGQEPGAFHYNPSTHVLERLCGLAHDFSMQSIVARPENLQFSGLIVFTAVWERSAAKYGDLAYQHSLLEAGHMSQNILLMAEALDLFVRPMAGFDDDIVSKLLDLDDAEQPLHAITLSKPSTVQSDAREIDDTP